MFLTADELHQLTGYLLPAYQRRWLTNHGWKFERAASGRPIVLRKHAEDMLSDTNAVIQAPAWEPNIAAMKKVA
jgi:hypothetical protein